MKTITVSFLFFAFMNCILLSQPPYHHSMISPQNMNQQFKFKVTSNSQVSTEKTTTIGTFHLGIQEIKAVSVIGKNVARLERESYPILKDTATKTGVFILPEIYYAKEKGTDNQIMYRILYVDSAPLRFDFGAQLFIGGIRFLAVETNYSVGAQPVQKFLSTPEEILVSFGSESIPLSINSINWPPRDVIIKSPNPIDSIEVKILTISNPLGYPKTLLVEPAISLSSIRTVFQGLGIQTIPISVALKGITSYRPIPVTVQTSLGKIDLAYLTLSDNKPQVINLRSESLGNVKIEVVNTNFRSNSISVKEKFPWIFLICALIGGLIGSIGNKLNNKEKITLSSIILGCIFGLVAAVAYWGLGIKLLNISLEAGILNEAMVFGVGLLAGYFGIKLSMIS